MLPNTHFAATFKSTVSSPRLGILNSVLDFDLSPPAVPPRPKPGPAGWEELLYRQLRLRRMVYLLINGYSYRAIAKDLGVARTTVMRMKAEAASFSAYTTTSVPMIVPRTTSPARSAEPAPITTGGVRIREH